MGFRVNRWVWIAGIGIITSGILFGSFKGLPKPGLGGGGSFTGDGPDSPSLDPAGIAPIAAKNVPLVVGFKGDLEHGGNRQRDGSIIPFVIGDILILDADASNATEYRWTVNGEPLKEHDQEWTRRKDREYEIKVVGELNFGVQVRAANPGVVSPLCQKIIKTVPLFIESFEMVITQDSEDRCLTGGDYAMEVFMYEPFTADLDFYKFRYYVNDVITKHPDDGEEWTSESDFTYTFPAPGQYSFKVEVRRAEAKEPEVQAKLAQTITVADAILTSFDAYPEQFAPLGTTINLDVFNESIFGKSECRFGVKNIIDSEFKWLTEEDGSEWGASQRSWLPTQPDTYLIRAEVREPGKAECDDFRQILYRITEGDF